MAKKRKNKTPIAHTAEMTAAALNEQVDAVVEVVDAVEQDIKDGRKQVDQLKKDLVTANNDFRRDIIEQIAKSRTLTEQANAKSDDFSQKTATLSAAGKNLNIDNGGALDRIVHALAAGMATAVTDMRALGLPAKEFAAKTLAILKNYENGINTDPALNLEGDENAAKAKTEILKILDQYKASVAEAGELSSIKLLGNALKSGLTQGIADTVKAFPGMATMDKLATMMGATPVSDRINETFGLDQTRKRELDTSVAGVEGEAAESLNSVLRDRTKSRSSSGFMLDDDSPVPVRRGRGMSAGSAYSFAEDTSSVLGGDDALGYLKSIDDTLHEMRQQGEDTAKRDIEAAQDANEARGERDTDAKRETLPDLMGKAPVAVAGAEGGGLFSTIAPIIAGFLSTLLKARLGFSALKTAKAAITSQKEAAVRLPGAARDPKTGRFMSPPKAPPSGGLARGARGLVKRAPLLGAAIDAGFRVAEGQTATQIGVGTAASTAGFMGGASAGAMLGAPLAPFTFGLSVPILSLLGGFMASYAASAVADTLTGVGKPPADDNSPAAEGERGKGGVPEGPPIPNVRTKFNATRWDDPAQPQTIELAQQLSGVPNFEMITATKDNFHLNRSGKTGGHNSGRAVDFTVAGGKLNSAAAAEAAEKIVGRGGYVQNEYLYPSPGSTGGHIHVEWSSPRGFPKEDSQATSNAPSNATINAPRPSPIGESLYDKIERLQHPVEANYFREDNSGVRVQVYPSRDEKQKLKDDMRRDMGDISHKGGGGPTPMYSSPGSTRNAGTVSAATAGLASAGAAAPIIVANMGGSSAPAARSVTMMMPIPIPIRPRTEDMVLRAIQSVNYI